MLANAEINNQELYKDIVEKANKFEKKFNEQKVENKKIKGKNAVNINKKAFYTITFGEFISNVGDRFQKIAFPILIYQEFHSSFAMGGMVIIELLPQFFLRFVMGYLLDNFNKKKYYYSLH